MLVFLALWCRGLTGPWMSNSYVLVQESALHQRERTERSETVLMLLRETDQIWENDSVGRKPLLNHRLVNVPTGVNKRLLWPWKLKRNPFFFLSYRATPAGLSATFAWNNLCSFTNWYKNKCLVMRLLRCQNSISSPLPKWAKSTSLTGVINQRSLSTELTLRTQKSCQRDWKSYFLSKIAKNSEFIKAR